jgi:hypothetical protein
MKILILLSCAFVISQAGYASPYHYFQPQAVIGPDGQPIETPEVQYAKAAHLAAHAEAKSRIGYYGYAPHNALPLDTPEVAAAKAQHFHDYAVAAQRNAVYAPYTGLYGAHPVDTPEVQHAKAAHFAAYAEAASRSGYGHGHYRRRRGIYDYHIPVLDHNGVPVETPEVQAAKAHHFSEYAKVLSRPGQDIPDNAEYSYGGGAGHYVAAPSAPAAYSHAPISYYRGPGGPPAQIGHDGQPLETPEVQAAKAAHFAAHQAVSSGHPGYYHY